MEGSGLRCFFFVPLFLLLQLAAFGASAPSGNGGALEEEKLHKKEGPELQPSVASSPLIKSTQPQSGATSLDSSQTSGLTEAKDSKDLASKTKNLGLPVSNSLVRNPDLKDPKDSENLQPNSKSSDVPDPQNSHPKDTENLAPASESSQPHPPGLDSAAQKTDLKEDKQSGSLPVESKNVKPVASVPKSPSLNADPKETKGTENLLPSTENDLSGAAVPPHNSDHNEANQNEKLPEGSKTLDSGVSLVDPSRKSDPNEDKQSVNSPEKSKKTQSDISVADSPKSDQNEAIQNEKKPDLDAADAESTPQKSDGNEANPKDSVPAVPENDLADTSAPKDDGEDEDGMIDDETIGGGKEGEETAETSQSEKEEVKNSPVGPSPKNESENSHFFAYLVTTAIIVAALYIAYHNKRKIIAFALEGKKSKVIRRPKSSDYQRLDQKI